MTSAVEKRLCKLESTARSGTEIVEIAGVRMPAKVLDQLLKDVQKRGSRLPVVHKIPDEMDEDL